MSKHLVFVDCEARGVSPVRGTMTEFGAVHYPSRATFHGRLFESRPDPANPAVPVAGARISSGESVAGDLSGWLREVIPGWPQVRPVMVSDNPAWDFMWIAGLFDSAELPNPFGHSARRISDFWAGLNLRWSDTQSWKRLRVTPHDHNPVHDALGNLEAYDRIMAMIEAGEFR